jgi:diaminohydroxyphosphoribosylaminopyrimidine deaminase/5-amino-6-(5-phosphoribosylamino)uracil reductase
MSYLCFIHHSPLTLHQKYMERCLELAKQGAGFVAPNPMVGAVLVHEDRIIGEGWHQQYGGPHAEVHCIGQAIQNGQTDKLNRSTLYVALEPCVHHGKTPPCTDLIIQHKIPKVVIGCRDPFKEVNGKGIEKLKAAGVEVEVGVLEKECQELNKRFFTFHTKQRPYVILKWAQTDDGFLASPNPSQGGALESSILESIFDLEDSPEVPPCGGFRGASRLLISNEYSNRLVHKWRSEEASILVGTNTAMMDDPELTTRSWPGSSPLRLVVDMDLRLPASLKLFNGEVKTIVFNSMKQEEKKNLIYYKLIKDKTLVSQLMTVLYELQIQSVIVEGGAILLQSFIDEGIWDEARVIKNEKLEIRNKESGIASGLKAPVLSKVAKIYMQKIFTDKIEVYKPNDSC